MADGMDLDFRICFTFNNAEFMRNFDHTVNVLVKAYLNNTLKHRECCACAVGNIIKANGYLLERSPRDDKETFWLRYIDHVIRNRPILEAPYDEVEALRQIDSTGYTPLELSMIERAFENCYYHPSHKFDAPDESMFNGLMAVVDVLAGIHSVDLEVKESAKLLFVK